jgi:hypothetical protein
MPRVRFPLLATPASSPSVLSHEYCSDASLRVFDLDKKVWLHIDATPPLEPRVWWLRQQIAAQTKVILAHVMLLTVASQEGLPDNMTIEYADFGTCEMRNEVDARRGTDGLHAPKASLTASPSSVVSHCLTFLFLPSR